MIRFVLSVLFKKLLLDVFDETVVVTAVPVHNYVYNAYEVAAARTAVRRVRNARLFSLTGIFASCDTFNSFQYVKLC